MKEIDKFFETFNFDYLSTEEKVEEPYNTLWQNIYMPSQEKKARENSITQQQKIEAFNGLSKRGKFLCQVYDFFECNNIAEVGTAEGYQFFTFCDHLKRNNKSSKVYTCDIRDVRNKSYVGKYSKIENFILGTSKEMSEKIISDKEKIDLFWIDGAHDTTAVINDVIRLAKTQSENCVWVFDDYNERFGIYQELKYLSNFGKSHTLSLGPTASGKPNNMLIITGGF